LIVNIWIALSDTAQSVVVTALRWDAESQGEYSGPLTSRQIRLFKYMQDDALRRSMYASATLQGTTYNLWSIDFDTSKSTLQSIQDEIDGLIAQYPNQIAIVGAWLMDGRQAGTQWADEERTATTGTPVYPIPNWLWRFMPQLLDGDGNPLPTQPSSNADLQDVNLLFGQTPRIFI
jgi:hypothetical protein